MRAEGHGTVSESDANLAQKAAGHAATDASAALMTLLAKAISTSKAINHVADVGLLKAPYNMGYIVSFYSLKKTMTSNSSQYRWNRIKTTLRMFKMYPHFMECYDDVIKVAGFNYDPIDNISIYQKLNPKKFFPQYYANGTSSVLTTKKYSRSVEDKMSKFLYDFVFKPWLSKSEIDSKMPPIRQCGIEWTPYSIGLSCRDKKYDFIHAEIRHSGKICITVSPRNGSRWFGAYGCEYEKDEMGEQVNILATDPYDN